MKGIDETVRVLRDGKLDDVFTEHWDETIDAYLPSGIAHLFFFDGEQIKDLAEGGHAAEILGAAIHALLGVDLMDRLESDLKVFERRKKAEGLDAAQALEQARAELRQIEQEQEQAAMEEGALVNQAGQLGKEQVLLLSTDEEIAGPYYEALQPFISRSYLLAHSDEQGMTNLEPGYFAKNAPIRGNDSVLSWRPEDMTGS